MITHIYYDTEKEKTDVCAIGELKYGTLVTNVKGHPDLVYMKVDRRGSSTVSISKSSGHSVLVNLKSGTLRSIHHTTQVRVLNGRLKTSKGIAERFLKWDNFQK